MLRKLIADEVTTFEPEAVEVLHRAYSEVCSALHIFAGDIQGQEAIATRVIDLARTGVVDAGILRERVLQEVEAVRVAVTRQPPPIGSMPAADGMR
jgi:hypothetical protein